MSVWADIRKRGIGAEIKKEDKVEEENSWNTKWDIKIEMEKLNKQYIKLNSSISDLRRELDKFSWDKKRYSKCNYKI
jgi:predicted  nucleic acid-binding Zn-ribbon protein